ncbi:MAG: hypothetical protein WAX69_21725 [Victivallales bacterium]
MWGSENLLRKGSSLPRTPTLSKPAVFYRPLVRERDCVIEESQSFLNRLFLKGYCRSSPWRRYGISCCTNSAT